MQNRKNEKTILLSSVKSKKIDNTSDDKHEGTGTQMSVLFETYIYIMFMKCLEIICI